MRRSHTRKGPSNKGKREVVGVYDLADAQISIRPSGASRRVTIEVFDSNPHGKKSTALQKRSAGEPGLEVPPSRFLLLFGRLVLLFGDADKAIEWLNQASPYLKARPADLLRTPAGAQKVEDEIIRLEHGILA